jgi:hypothetical protein
MDRVGRLMDGRVGEYVVARVSSVYCIIVELLLQV